MINEAPTTSKKGAKTKITKAQESYLTARGLHRDGLTKQEASAMIHARKQQEGWKPNANEFVQNGKHAGKHFSQVPPAYWGILAKKFAFSPAYKEYVQYKKTYGGKK